MSDLGLTAFVPTMLKQPADFIQPCQGGGEIYLDLVLRADSTLLSLPMHQWDEWLKDLGNCETSI